MLYLARIDLMGSPYENGCILVQMRWGDIEVGHKDCILKPSHIEHKVRSALVIYCSIGLYRNLILLPHGDLGSVIAIMLNTVVLDIDKT